MSLTRLSPILLAVLLLLWSCAPLPQPVPRPEPMPGPIDKDKPVPPPIPIHDLTFVVRDPNRLPIAGARVTLEPAPSSDQATRRTDGHGFAHFGIPDGRYTATVEAQGFRPWTGPAESAGNPLPLEVVLDLDRPPTVRGRLSICGRAFCYPDGSRFPWHGVTGFQLADHVADGRINLATQFLLWARDEGFTLVRVLTMAAGLFQLAPGPTSHQAVAETLRLAREADLYVEVVALADTLAYPLHEIGIADQVGAVAAVCNHAENCVLELANENSHPSQQSGLLTDLTVLRALRQLAPSTLPVSLGSTHGPDDESTRYQEGDYLTVHSDRSRDLWNQLRRVREIALVSEIAGKPAIDDENDRTNESTARPDRDFAQGFLDRGFVAGGTWHCEDCRFARVPRPAQREAARAYLRGATIIPINVDVAYRNAGQAGSPVRRARFFAPGPADALGADAVVRVYSFVMNGRGWTILLGIDGDPGIEWQEGWQPLDRVDEPWAAVEVLMVRR